MTALWTANAIAEATGGTVSGHFAATGVAFDSREIGPGDLFVALRGDATDGHHFVDAAVARGAAGALVSQPIASPHVRVADTTAALDALARAARARTTARVIAVTGSAGKTGTKEALAAALARRPGTRVHRSVKSYNNHVGVPLSLARMPADSDFAVLEAGMNHAGELSALTRLIRPDVAIVTTIAPAHIEYFGSEDAIADAKGEIFGGLADGGTAIIPYDNAHRDRLIGHAGAARVVTFGRGAGADVRARDVFVDGDATLIQAELPGGRSLSFRLSQPGAHWVANALAVIAAVDAVGGDIAAAGLALGALPGLAGRGARLSIATADGGRALLIDESYNANAASMAATLSVLGDTPARRRIAVLGEMRELGAASDALHVGLAAPIAAAKVDFAILVGPAMAALAAKLEGAVDFRHVPDAAAARQAVAAVAGDGDAILVKGSNGVGLSAVVAALGSE